jgi:hypothetical protein
MSVPTEPHTFDPYGDLLLVLSKPFDPADPPKTAGNHEDADVASIQNGSRGQEAATNRDRGDRIKTPAHSEDSASPQGGSGESGLDDTIQIPMLLSSRHMMLASPVFKAMLDRNFKERREIVRISPHLWARSESKEKVLHLF